MRAAAFFALQRRRGDQLGGGQPVAHLRGCAARPSSAAIVSSAAIRPAGIADDADISVMVRRSRRHILGLVGLRRFAAGAAPIGPAGLRLWQEAVDVVGDTGGEDDGLEQRVRGEPVGAMRPRARGLAARPKTVDGGSAIRIHENAAHVVVRGRRHRDRLLHRIDPGIQAVFVDRRELRREGVADRLARVEIDRMAGADMAVDRLRDDVARREFHHRMDAFEEAEAGLVDQRRAGAADRFGRQRRRIAADGKRGRVELDEFGIGDDRAGTRRHGEAGAFRFGRIGRHRIEMAAAAHRQHDGAGGEEEAARLAAHARADAGDVVAFGVERLADHAFERGGSTASREPPRSAPS